MKEFMMKMVPVDPRDHFPFQCQQCGACCRHVRESVPLESLDAFRLAKYLRDRGEPIRCMDDVLARYAIPVLLHESGYTVFMLSTVGPDDACIFLKDNQCTIHAAKPRACRTYPISVGPAMAGGFEAYLSMEQTHHFNGPQQSENGFRSAVHGRTMTSGKRTLVLHRRLRNFWRSFPLGRKKEPYFNSSVISIRSLIWTSLSQNSSGTIIRNF